MALFPTSLTAEERERLLTAIHEVLGEGLERWEMKRKVRRFTRQPGDHSEAFFSPDCCKGHFGGHRTRALAALNERLGRLGLEAAG